MEAHDGPPRSPAMLRWPGAVLSVHTCACTANDPGAPNAPGSFRVHRPMMVAGTRSSCNLLDLVHADDGVKVTTWAAQSRRHSSGVGASRYTHRVHLEDLQRHDRRVPAIVVAHRP